MSFIEVDVFWRPVVKHVVVVGAVFGITLVPLWNLVVAIRGTTSLVSLLCAFFQPYNAL